MIEIRSDIGVEVVKSWGGDRDVADAGWQTTKKQAVNATDEEVRRFLRMLIRFKHGEPVEFGGDIVFQVHAPIFVFEQWFRHRIGWSRSRVSGRWHREGSPPPLEPVFWVPRRDRPMVAAFGHKPTAPKYERAIDPDYDFALSQMRLAYSTAWHAYEHMIECGIAAEVARAVLGTGVYTSARLKCNPRSLIAFLSKRISDPRNEVVTHPQHEIEEAALACERVLAAGWPILHAEWVEAGRAQV